MIAKISSGNSPYGALSYNQNKVDSGHAKVIFAANMKDPEDGIYSMSVCLKSFESRLMANRRTEKPVLHVSLNPDPKDKLTDEHLSEIAQIYMQKMGYGDQPFIVYKHEDIERHHLHIVSLRICKEGKKINDKFEHRRSMDVCRELEQKYGLVPADQKTRQEGLPLKPVCYENGDVKHQIANVIRPISQSWHFQSFKEYKALLSLYKVEVEEVRGEINDKAYRGLMYFALDDKGEKTGNPFKSSLFGKSVGIEALEKRIEKSTEIIKNKGLKERSKKIIAEVMHSTNNRMDFENRLKKQGISAIFRENQQGRIYGVTFVDHEQKCVFNGSRLGKEFSANVFNEKFSLNHDSHDLYDYHDDHGNHTNHANQENHSSDIFDLFTPFLGTDVEDEIAEQDFIRRLKKKKKQRHL